MTPKDAREFFKTGYRMKKMTGLAHNLLGVWERNGHIPKGSQAIIELKTEGQLKIDDEVSKNDEQ